jgi:polysaccharide deacetylase family protein (PEP-CTERM system associated)
LISKVSPHFLFSVDLEDVRDMVPNGMMYTPKVPELTKKYLDFLKEKKSFATFFVVGSLARKYPDLIKLIRDEGHELGCHSDKHLPVSTQNQEDFRSDLEANINALKKAGVNNIYGYRAPTFSLTEEVSWVYPILEEFNLTYSSSVLPARNPLFGWPGFGDLPKKVGAITEVPITLSGTSILNVPFAGGVYLRALPYPLIDYFFKKAIRRTAVTSYIHPYDIDTEQEPFMHPYINDNKFYNFLLYYNRKNALSRISKLVKKFELNIIPYKQYIDSL